MNALLELKSGIGPNIGLRLFSYVIIILVRKLGPLSPYGFDGAGVTNEAFVGRELLVESLIGGAVALPLRLLGLQIIVVFVLIPLVFTQHFFSDLACRATFLQKWDSVVLHDYLVEALENLKFVRSKDLTQLELLLLLLPLHFQNIIKLFAIVDFFADTLQFLGSLL